MHILKYKMIDSPVGSLKIVVNEGFLVAVLWDNENPKRVRLAQKIEDQIDPLILETEKQLKEYFFKQRKEFNLPLEINGTLFQEGVWKLLRKIPYGTTASYKDIAVKMHNPFAVRAVGSANGRNPISIIIPCHR
ncbi:MAG: methylated-DNA--[protein]-cysteine S-methyltransferase, partial [Parachlamydiaceae bacterium]|nr:methylated-DNA--[protein]-cysteine S-methyltransferase [Parachlamydiaceae bacterium]